MISMFPGVCGRFKSISKSVPSAAFIKSVPETRNNQRPVVNVYETFICRKRTVTFSNRKIRSFVESVT